MWRGGVEGRLWRSLFVSNQGEGQHHSNSEAQQQAGDRPPADPSQRMITAYLMQCWKDPQYVIGHVALARSEEYLKLQSVQRIPAVPKDEWDTIFHEHFPQTDTVNPNALQANPAAPAEKKKAWNLSWGPLSWMADMSAQRPVTRFSLDLWMSHSADSWARLSRCFERMLGLGRCARATATRTFLLIRKAITCLLAKSTRNPTEATIMSWMSWRNWPATQATLCAWTTRYHGDDSGRK